MQVVWYSFTEKKNPTTTCRFLCAREIKHPQKLTMGRKKRALDALMPRKKREGRGKHGAKIWPLREKKEATDRSCSNLPEEEGKGTCVEGKEIVLRADENA